MAILIAYDSIYGNTKKIAEAIAAAVPGEMKLLQVKAANAKELESGDVLIVGSPTHGGRPSQSTHQFLNGIAPGTLKNIRAAAFDTGILADGQKAFMRLIIKFFGYASKRIAQALRTKGANIIGAETFFVLGKEGPLKEGELARAVSWIKGVLNDNKESK
ncbi:MAG: flavodoxin/nitric oxide synthase [Candidatus Kerfeldbacteria bacterium CG_4_10_14_0_8_um_filter_42_10]|uniref:Flavodoxin/nitric oxide synthase n=1 Tax=Candidatus Kerfeldbacteria bacterium CG_4_10_14_0_8_um_filter_42_10 TaxID=2014248 RepID=A0A2M7RK74_9BACT|nr:MAG: flavodoxin/nitric oxide synthase [Candidatus Kerfeldbacteria bacterium CG_4_10_14_0_8_um_filter_42_10]